MIDVTTKTLPDAVAELKAAGFTNVTSNASSDKEEEEIYDSTRTRWTDARGRPGRGPQGSREEGIRGRRESVKS